MTTPVPYTNTTIIPQKRISSYDPFGEVLERRENQRLKNLTRYRREVIRFLKKHNVNIGTKLKFNEGYLTGKIFIIRNIADNGRMTISTEDNPQKTTDHFTIFSPIVEFLN